MIVEVRCCCDVNLLLGYVQVDRRQLHEGDVLRFLLRPTAPSWKRGEISVTVRAEQLRLPVSFATGVDTRTGERFSRLAIKSDDTPIETLRRIAGFSEAGGNDVAR